MYVGHVGIALALRAPRDAPPLWLLVLAAQGPDWGDAVYEALHWRPALEYGAHGLIAVAIGTVAAAIVAALVARRTASAPAVAGALAALAYASHWCVDLLTGYKPTLPGHRMIGLGLYGRPLIDLVIECAVVLVGWAIWRASLRSIRRDRGGALALALLVALLTLQCAADLVMWRMAGSIP